MWGISAHFVSHPQMDYVMIYPQCLSLRGHPSWPEDLAFGVLTLWMFYIPFNDSPWVSAWYIDLWRTWLFLVQNFGYSAVLFWIITHSNNSNLQKWLMLDTSPDMTVLKTSSLSLWIYFGHHLIWYMTQAPRNHPISFFPQNLSSLFSFVFLLQSTMRRMIQSAVSVMKPPWAFCWTHHQSSHWHYI